MKNGVYIFWGLIIIVIVVVLGGSFFLSSKPGKLDTFAQCLKDKGAIFYGAFWCPHCQATKALFGRSAKLLPYVECSTPNGKDQLAVCKDAGIEGYPTWVFASGNRMTGELTLAQLAAETQCVLPQ